MWDWWILIDQKWLESTAALNTDSVGSRVRDIGMLGARMKAQKTETGEGKDFEMEQHYIPQTYTICVQQKRES